jgi:hypothetical protein
MLAAIITQINRQLRRRLLLIALNASHKLTVPKSFGMRTISSYLSIIFEKHKTRPL